MRTNVLTFFAVVALTSLLTAADARAWIGQGFGYSAPGPNGEYNVGGRVGRYGGLYYGGGGYDYNNYSGAYRSSFGYGRVSGLGETGPGLYAAGKATSDDRPDAKESDTSVILATSGRR